MKIKMKKYILLLSFTTAFTLAGCTGDLDQIPHAQDTAENIYSTQQGTFGALTKIYASYITTGQAKNGNNDMTSNRGFDFMRCYINLQEGPTDEMAYSWLSGEVMTGLTYMTWDSSDPWASDAYYRLYYTIALANSFLKETANSIIEGVGDYRNEARFLRALAYYYVLDLFGKGAFVTEQTETVTPPCYRNSELFAFIESELKAIADALPSRTQVIYGRVSRGAAYALLAKMYLNAEVYGAGAHYAECIAACDKVTAEGYDLAPDYASLFNADNDKRTEEIIFPFVVDAVNTVTWGATTYLVCGAAGGNTDQYGIASAWGNFRLRGEFVALFDGYTETDRRYLVIPNTGGSTFSGNIDNTSEGYFGKKFTNLTDAGEVASNTATDGVNTDYPVFRYADILLMKAEATVRNGGDIEVARGLIKQIRDRAFGASTTVEDWQLTLDEILKERTREMWWECTRRTDLVRYGYFTGDGYLWQWKGGLLNGRAVDSERNVYYIPLSEQEANENMR